MGFWNKYPYTDFHELNLDWVLEQIQKIASASGVTFDDTNAQLGASNVQEAIDAVTAFAKDIATSVSNFVLIENTIASTAWENGFSFTHVQTINNTMLMDIIEAMRGNKYIVITYPENDATKIFVPIGSSYNGLTFETQTIYYDVVSGDVLHLMITALNDENNVFATIQPKTHVDFVNSFNGRTGDVNPEAGDYTAAQVDYDDDITLLGASNVQAAIEALKLLIPLVVVSSFNGRSGAVSPTSGDYTGAQIDYDNTLSGLVATNVQTAIDEIITMIFASGVASFKGRTGVVNPQSGDYDASMITYDNTDSGLLATNVQDAIDEIINPPFVSVTLTINGAMEDSITIKDALDQTIGTCIFASGQTSGTASISVPVGGGSYKFISSVAKDTTTGTNDYEITVSLTDDVAQTVNVYPAKAMYWYGNFVDCTIYNSSSNGDITRNPVDANITVNTNNVVCVVGGDFKGIVSGTKYATETIKMFASFVGNGTGETIGVRSCTTDINLSPYTNIDFVQASTLNHMFSGTNTNDTYVLAFGYVGTATFYALWAE